VLYFACVCCVRSVVVIVVCLLFSWFVCLILPFLTEGTEKWHDGGGTDGRQKLKDHL